MLSFFSRKLPNNAIQIKLIVFLISFLTFFLEPKATHNEIAFGFIWVNNCDIWIIILFRNTFPMHAKYQFHMIYNTIYKELIAHEQMKTFAGEMPGYKRK
ncbi:hypothetical protein BpHYR1_049133 [Brachionus plicatilis]|uniref:Uncharacterized protein n=1 Tax=Brachionus plicatilis TaxID=10195 RepID=A0A3M7SKF3_BRAPC|nr:hypothetical protein BpHYR1_049133 [Brachionus plicatilis]